jgi:hypothetical protein
MILFAGNIVISTQFSFDPSRNLTESATRQMPVWNMISARVPAMIQSSPPAFRMPASMAMESPAPVSKSPETDCHHQRRLWEINDGFLLICLIFADATIQ